ncbi:MAG: alpha/beta hydrolase [Oscillibacter sp.]|nr:alpha/beta hydrolase [Oscillibacter sp.]
MKDCQTRYPILLLHGLNCRDDCFSGCWGRVPEALRERGAVVYLGHQDAWGSIEGNARKLLRMAEKILEGEGSEKLNLIAHSKGGLEARYLISSLGFADHTASLTTLCTPHRGARSAEVWQKRKIICAATGRALETGWRLFGDQAPDFQSAVASLTPEALERFNQENLDSPQVYYQSWGALLVKRTWDPMDCAQLWLTKSDGPTDALVTPESAAWGAYRGTLTDVSHQDCAGARRRRLSHFSAEDFFIRLVQELAEKGF